MRHALIATLVLSCIAGAALAQEEPAFTPEWGEPLQGQIPLPQRAFEAGVSGVAAVCCTPGRNGRLDCEVETETPAGWEFGRGAVRLIERRHRLTPASQAALTETGRPMRMRLEFQFRRDPLSANVREDYAGLCAAVVR